MTEVRVRFAPSPTGTLHIGGVRTALYSWLYARQKGGRFILRVEDTDQERSTEESARVIVDSMRWLGLDWDEGPEVGGPCGPYFQSQRLDLYAAAAEKLIASGHAYRCYATKEEIDAAREEFATRTGRKEGFSFESPYRDGLQPTDPGARHVIRFKAPRDGSTAWDDLVKGRIEIQHSTLQDFVLVRPDGMPLYNLGCVVDDHAMGITHVARGDDHMINTAPQILLYQALGAPVPTFAHVPMVLAPNGQKLSKRHAAVGVLDYRDMGYVPDAVLNYLVRLGWSHGDQEIFTRDELVEKFSWERVGAQASRYDAQKFAYVQAEHLRMMSDEALAAGAAPHLAARGVSVAEDDPRLVRAMPYLKPRAVTFPDLAEGAIYLLVDEPEMDEKAANKFLTTDAATHLRWLRDAVKDVEPFTDETLGPKVEQAMQAAGLTMKQVAQPARVALTGRTKSPGLFEVMELLGKDATLTRLERAIERASA
jgi:glutamyl-tRNA synthetase